VDADCQLIRAGNVQGKNRKDVAAGILKLLKAEWEEDV
jgi:hypothetical protein